MAARDIMPWRTPQGGTEKVETYHLQADETFHEGEVVRLDDASGLLEIAAHDPDVSNHTSAATAGAVGIAAEPAEGMATDADGTTNPAFADRGVWIFTSTQEFITANYTDDEDSNPFTNDATHAMVGDEVGLVLNTSGAVNQWGISENADTTHSQFRITAVLDADRQPIRDAVTEATYVVFRLNTCYAPGLPA